MSLGAERYNVTVGCVSHSETVSRSETRSNRALSHMDAETKVVHARLEAWANFVREPLNGWPRRTQLGRLIDGEIVRSLDRQPVSMPDEIAITDRAVAHLREIDRRVVETYYLTWAPVEIMARRLKMRSRQFENVLKRARWRLGGYLAAFQ